MFKNLLNKVTNKKKAAPAKKATKKSPKNPKIIAKYLKNALINNEIFEIRIDDHVMHRYTFLLDKKPDPSTADTDEAKAELEKSLSDYKDGGYLDELEKIYIIPPQIFPEEKEINAETQLQLQFYLGSMRYSFPATFAKQDIIDADPALQLNFPKDLDSTVGRSYHRVKIIKDYPVEINLYQPDGSQETLSLNDLSACGAAFSQPEDMPVPEIGEPIKIRLKISDKPYISLQATVRNNKTMPIYCQQQKKIVTIRQIGIQFHLTNRSTAAVIEEAVVDMQRIDMKRFTRL